MVSPFSPDDTSPASGGKKVSTVILDLAAYAFKNPLALFSRDARAASLMLAGAAWNSAVGDQVSCEQFRRQLAEADAKGSVPWTKLRANSAAELIALLVEFKKERHPDDYRRIVSLDLKPDGVVRAIWQEPDPASAGAAAATPISGKQSGVRPTGPRVPTAVPTSPPLPVVAEVTTPQTVSAGNATSARKVPRRQPIADKLLRAMKRYSRDKVVDLAAVISGGRNAEDLQRTIVSQEALARLHSAHAPYVYAQNVVSVLSEQLTGLKEMNSLARLIEEAEEECMPGGPPMSPLTSSYFTCWAFFDACVGIGKETIGSVGIAVASAFGMHSELLRVIGLMQQSRMGIYVHQGLDKDAVLLRELVTGRSVRAISPAGYMGQKGELWYVRVLPPPSPAMREHVAFTTPYLLLKANEYEWQSYFRRTLPDASQEARIEAYERHMKYGPSRKYWNEFVTEAYVNFRSDVIYLTGLPDIPESLPHSSANRDLWR